MDEKKRGFLLLVVIGLAACGGSKDGTTEGNSSGGIDVIIPDGATVDVPTTPDTLPEIIELDSDGPVSAADCIKYPDGTVCDDNNVCTVDDICSGGVCVGSTNLVCDDEDPCRPGNCDPATGCIYESVEDGTPCLVKCFDSAACVSGECVPEADSAVQCPPSTDACISEFACESTTGACTKPIYAPAGTPCESDDDLCSLDTCNGTGACSFSGEIESCSKQNEDSPCWTWTCSPSKGCLQTLFIEGGSCNDNNPCTFQDTCVAVDGFKSCLGTPVTTDDQNPCTDDFCEGGVVKHTPLIGAACQPEGECQNPGICDGIICVPALPCECDTDADCPAVGCLGPGSCVDGDCTAAPVPDGTPCNDGDGCTTGDICSSGLCAGYAVNADDGNPCTADSCVGGQLVHTPTNGAICPSDDPCSNSGVCNIATCVPDTPCACLTTDDCPEPSNKCDDKLVCDTSLAVFACVPQAGTAVVCPETNEECTVAVCQPETGECEVVPVDDGTACDDGIPCTVNNQCSLGTCTGSLVVCDSPSGCQSGGQCDEATGDCVYDPLEDGVPCNDNDPCTTGDVCLNGTCESGDPVVCTATAECQVPGLCDPETGACSFTVAQDGASCNDGEPCSQGDTCVGGSCISGTDSEDGLECGEGFQCADGICLPPLEPLEPTQVTRISVGVYHTCAVRNDGSVACWGRNTYGMLGQGVESLNLPPVQDVELPKAAISVSVGQASSCALLVDGTVWCWGLNDDGQLGTGDDSNRLSPVWINQAGQCNAISLGDDHACAVRTDNQVVCWGLGTDYQLGTGENTTTYEPTLVPGLTDAVRVSAGTDHTCALRDGATMVCWGGNTGFKAGQPTGTYVTTPTTYTKVLGISGISAGGTHTCTITAGDDGGEVLCFGSNTKGQLGGIGGGIDPVAAVGINDAVSIDAGDDFTCAVRSNGQVLCWGEGGDGQCGQGAYESVDTPVLVPDIDDAIEVSAGKVSACALRASGEVLCWGQNGFGQIGDGTTNSTNLAVAVEGLGPHGTCAACDDQNPCTINYCVPDAQCASEAVPDGTPCSTDMMCAAGECSESSPIPHNTIAVGEYFAAAVRIDGTVVTWGGNTHGQLGSGELNTLLRTAPNDVVGLSDVVSLVSGDDHLCALTSNATVYCWGLGNNGQLGNGGNIASPSVTAVSNLNDVVQIAASASSTCALKSNGSVWCWGLNLQKQLGTPAANVLENIPIQVDSITDAVRIGSGSEHFCAIRKGGELRCWGQGSGGSLGNGSSNNADTPVVVFPGIAGLRHTTSITGGGNLTCALNAVDNSPVCWGSASYGQLGDNSGSSSVTPVPLSELSGQTWLKTGRHHSCSLGPTGQLTCWGRNSEGQLALGNLSNTPSPTTIPTVGPVKEVAAGPYNTCIRLAADDTIYCTGRNLQGQVGDGTTTSRVSLVKVQGLSTYGQCADCQDSSPCTTSFCGPDSCLVTTAADTTPCGVQETCTSGQCNNSPPSHSRLAAGFSHTCALTSSGVVKCWGSNAYGQTGTGAQTNLVTEPTSVNGTSGVHITAKGFSTCVLTADGGAPVMCWGRNHAGQLGNGTGLNSYNPATVVGVNDFVSVDLGSSHGCGLRVNGGVECWGLDNSGQLGNGGTAATQASPSAVVLSAAAAQISAGYEHSCAVLAGGQAICWGEGSFGRLGYGGSADQQLPQQVAPGQALLWEARQVVAAKNHSCAVSSTGSVTCWGNGPEQLANVASSTTPQFSPLQNIARLAAGLTHTCGIDESEQLWCWGNNLNGQIGNDTFDTPDAPYMLPLTGVTDVTTGGKHTCAFADGGLYCWGSNESQQLGVTTPTATQKVPILVPGW